MAVTETTKGQQHSTGFSFTVGPETSGPLRISLFVKETRVFLPDPDGITWVMVDEDGKVVNGKVIKYDH